MTEWYVTAMTDRNTDLKAVTEILRSRFAGNASIRVSGVDTAGFFKVYYEIGAIDKFRLWQTLTQAIDQCTKKKK